MRLRLEPWQRNLVVVWIAQFITVLGFSFVFPFIPLFVQDDLGISDPGRAALWSGIASGAMGLSLFLSGPLWGIVGDRYGRKKNTLRALFASAVLMALTALVANVHQLVALRLLTGAFSGVFATSLALVSAGTPRRHLSFATGVLQSAMFIGSTFGPLFGGIISDLVGFRASFLVTGSLLATSGVLVMLLVREDFHPQAAPAVERRNPLRDLRILAFSPSLFPVLVLIYLVQAAPTLMFPVLPVFVRELLGDGFSVGRVTGLMFAVLGVASTISALVIARLSQRVSLKAIMTVGCFAAAAVYLPMYLAGSVVPFIISLTVLGLVSGGMVASAMALVGLVVPPEKHGTAYGVVQSASSLAFGFGPLIGGGIATLLGLRAVFLFNMAAFFLAGMLVSRLIGSAQSSTAPPAPQPLAVSSSADD